MPIGQQTLEETYQMSLINISNTANLELWRDMKYIQNNPNYQESLRAAIRDALELITKLKNASKSQRLQQTTQNFDQYYAFPLFTLVAGEVLKTYFDTKQEEPEDNRFRDILARYLHNLYPVTNVLPIGTQYQDFPFVVFRSYSLEEMRLKLLTDKYLLNSNELNILNMILARDIIEG